MHKQDTLSHERLKELLNYDPETGEFTWRVSRGGRAAGGLAGYTDQRGYTALRVDKTLYFAHRLAWLYVHGVWPPAEIDHINGIPSDNRLANLRSATRSENSQNQRRPQRGNKLGVLGVSRSYSKFQAHIQISGVSTYLGVFPTIEEAAQAYIEAKSKYHPFSPFANVS